MVPFLFSLTARSRWTFGWATLHSSRCTTCRRPRHRRNAGGGLRESHAALRLVAAVARLQRTTNKPISCSGKPWLGCLQTRDTQGRMEAGALAALAEPRGQACVSYDSHPSTNTTLRLPKVETSGRLIQETTQEVFGADGIDPVSFSSCATVHSMRRACYDPAV